MKRTLLSVILALLTLIPLSAATKLPSILPLVWEGHNHCTTFSINEEKGLWSTAFHCVSEAHPFQIGGVDAQVVVVSQLYDSAVLSGPQAPALPFSPTAPKPGDKLVVRGFPLGIVGLINPITTTEGKFLNTFEDEDGVWNMYDVTAAPGNSGSPVITKRGVIGTLNFGWNGAGRLGGGTTWAALKQLFDAGVWVN